jgi:DNA primase catalytic core
LKASTDIVEVISRNVDLNESNTGLCPFHGDVKPSFKVYPETHSWFCFGCSESGDVIKFMMMIDGSGFVETVVGLAKELGLEMPKEVQEEATKQKQVAMGHEVLTIAAAYCHTRLTSEVRAFLTQERGLTGETISRFMIGFADGTLRDHLILERKLHAELCVNSGVLSRTKDGRVLDFFLNRIVVPNLKQGKVIHLTGRSAGSAEPKYLHLPGKIQHLFNEDALDFETVIVTEGPFDCIAAEQMGYHAVASYGTSGFKPGFETKFSHCKSVYVCMDGDEPGRAAAVRVAEALGVRARIVALPEGVDLNDFFLAHGKPEFETLLTGSRDLINYLLECIPVGIEKTELADELLPVLRVLARLDPPKAEGYLGVIKARYDLTREDITAYRGQLKALRGAATKEARLFEESQEEDAKYTTQFEGLVDLVEAGGKVSFLTMSDGQLTVGETAKIEAGNLLPPPKELIPWLLPRGKEVVRHFERYKNGDVSHIDRKLFTDLVAYHQRNSELPGEGYYDFVALWVLHTYLFEQWEYSPFICLFAVPERGKSRTGKGIVYAAYRGVHVESLREAYLLRLASDYAATLFIDVMDVWKKAEKLGSEDIILQRFERGAKVFRVLFPERGPFKDMRAFKIFGPTVVGTNEAVDQIMETRCIVINMPSTDRVFENDVKPEMGLELRERLLAFRAWHMNHKLPQIEKPAERRLGDVLRPIMQVLHLVCPDREDAMDSLIAELERQRQERKSETLEGEILKAVYVLKDKTHLGKLKVADITSEVNANKLERFKTTEKSVGRKLTALGFHKVWSSDSRRAITYDEEFLKKVCEKYGIHIDDVEGAKG